MSCRLIVLIFCLTVAVSAYIQTKKIGKKIIGGRTTVITVIPYQVSLQYYDWHLCGGSVISPSWILTAAHCVKWGSPENYTVRAGSTVHWSGGVLVNVSKIIRHPYFNVNVTNNYDVAILKLKDPLNFSRTIKPIFLSDFEPKKGDQLLVSGWGYFNDNKIYSDNLQSAVIPVVSRKKCNNIHGFIRPITGSMICAGFTKGGKDSCTADSGGPAVFNNKQVGVVSWGMGCALKNSPGVYANVASIKTWVESEIKKEVYVDLKF